MNIEKLFGKKKKVISPSKKVSWWQAGIFLIGITVAGRLSAGKLTTGSQRKQYRKEVKPVWSPPGWVFGPAWSINNICQVWALRRLLNANKDFPERDHLLQLQGIHWFIFVTFSYVFFKKKSPVLATIWTQGDAIIALKSLLLAREGDKKLSWSYAPLVIWTWFASSVSWFQALYNPDPLLQTDAPLKIEGGMKKLMK